MITIDGKEFLADRKIEIVRENSVPTQRVENGFDVQDHIARIPLQLKTVLILFDESSSDTRETAYKHLKGIYEGKQLVDVDCSEHSQNDMIYANMAMTHLGQVVQRGNTYSCDVLFTQITKTTIVSKTLHVQEKDVDGEMRILWSDKPIKEPPVEALAPIDEKEDQPVVLRAPIEAMPSSIKPGGLVNNILDWVGSWF